MIIHKTDIVCLSETYLNSSFPVNDENLVIQGCNLVRCDQFSNSKRGGVCIYYKDFLPLKIIDIQYLQERINFHLIIGDKLCHFILLYRSPNQSDDYFNSFIKSLELNFDKATTFNPFLVVVLGDFNAKPCNWCINDKTNFEGANIDTLTSQNGLQQIIKKPTHILDASSSSIDFFLTSQSNLVINSGAHISLHANCYHQIIYAKFNLQMYYPPPYERVMWHYKHANSDHFRKSICGFNWERSFANKDINEMVNIFNETISNALSILFLMRLYSVMIKIPNGLITKSKKRYKRKISFLAELCQILLLVLF